MLILNKLQNTNHVKSECSHIWKSVAFEVVVVLQLVIVDVVFTGMIVGIWTQVYWVRKGNFEGYLN